MKKGSTDVSDVASFLLWPKLPPDIKLYVFRQFFRDASSTYLFAPGFSSSSPLGEEFGATGNKTVANNFAITNTYHINLLYTSKRTWQDGIEPYLQTAKIVFRGYEKLMHESLPRFPTLCRYVVELNVPLHFVRWMLLRGSLPMIRTYQQQELRLISFAALQRVVMEDMSRSGFIIGEDESEDNAQTASAPADEEPPSDAQIVAGLFRRESELSRIRELLLPASAHNGGPLLCEKDYLTDVEVLFHFELFHRNKETSNSSADNVSEDTTQMKTRAMTNEQGDKTLPVSIETINDYIVEIKTKKLKQIGTRLRIHKG